jgi:hypothetical protein
MTINAETKWEQATATGRMMYSRVYLVTQSGQRLGGGLECAFFGGKSTGA